jgi:hypothetical protein
MNAHEPYARCRQHFRVACHLPARARNAFQAVAGRCRNLSYQGMLLSGDDDALLPVGESVDLLLELPVGGSVRVCGEVRYHCALPEGQRAMGILFTNMAEGHLARLRRFLDDAQQLGDAPQPGAAQQLSG